MPNKKRWNCCDAAEDSQYTGILDYWLTLTGRVMCVRLCPNGHRRTQFIPLEAVPLDSLELRRIYIQGAAAGFLLGRRGEIIRFGESVRGMAEWMSAERVADVIGKSESLVKLYISGTYPRPLKDESAKAIEEITQYELGARVA